MKHVSLRDVEFDSRTQLRAEINSDTMRDYAAAMEAGEKFPPVELFQDGKRFFIGDGWHRILAAQENGDVTIPANLSPGGRSAAIKFALKANATHGLKRTNADKQKAIRVALNEFPDLSDRAIAELCAVHHETVATYRTPVQVAESANSTANEPTKRTGRDGKKYAPAVPAKPKVAAAEIIELTDEESRIAQEEANRIADEELAKRSQEGQSASATPAESVRAPILKPSGTIGSAGFDSTPCKNRTQDFLKREFMGLPANRRKAWIAFTRGLLDGMETETE